MKTVWKYEIGNNTEILVPEGAEFLAFANQKGVPCIWVRVDPEAPKEVRRLRLVETGQLAPESAYLGTILMEAGEMVLHLFEEEDKE